MTITIAPFKVNPSRSHIIPQIGHEKEKHDNRYYLPITYWGIYLDDKYISYTSSKELAEKTKVWMEKWLRDRH
jgi:hypothetical protein